LIYILFLHPEIIQIPLNIPKEKSQNFMDYLNTTLRAKFSRYEGSSHFNPDGSFKSIIKGSIELSSLTPITITLKQDHNGNLVYLEATPQQEDFPKESWATSFSELVTSILTATLAGNLQNFFQRELFYYIGAALDGEYWLPGFRFAPVNPKDEFPKAFKMERVVSFDMDIQAIDSANAFSLARERASRYAARLSLLLDFALYRPISFHNVWILQASENSNINNSIRGQRGYYDRDNWFKAMPRKGAICVLGKYAGSLSLISPNAGVEISLPKEARKILRTVDSAPPEIKFPFDKAARLYQVGMVIGAQIPSAGIAYKVAALGTFLRSYSTNAVSDQVIEYIWSRLRSAHFHGGEFPSGGIRYLYNA
jgi:hypothetical protein